MINKVTIMNEARRKYRLEHEEEVCKKAEDEFEQFKHDPLFIAGIMLYWAEGTQLPKYRKYQLALTNSTPELLEVYCKFLRKYFDNIETGLRAALFIYQDISEIEAKQFWSDKLNIPKEQFIKTQILPSRSRLTETKLPYGTCCVYLNSKDYCLTVHLWINKMANAMRG